jgi:hypothetical protein
MAVASNPAASLIFLDIDGVLNRWNRPGPHSPLLVEPHCMENLNSILDAVPDVKIVVTSSLRMLVHSGEMTVHGLEYLLRSHGMRGSLAEGGVTAADALLIVLGIRSFTSMAAMD